MIKNVVNTVPLCKYKGYEVFCESAESTGLVIALKKVLDCGSEAIAAQIPTADVDCKTYFLDELHEQAEKHVKKHIAACNVCKK